MANKKSIVLPLIILLLSMTTVVSGATNYASKNDSIQRMKAMEEIHLGDKLFYQIHREEAALHYSNALDIFVQLNDLEGVAGMYKAIGESLGDVNGKVDDAIKAYRKAADIYKEIGKYNSVVVVLINTRKLYLQIEQMKEYAEISTEINEWIAKLPPSTDLYYMLGTEKSDEGNHKEAIGYLQKACELSETEIPEKGVPAHQMICMDLAVAHYFSGNYDEAITLTKKMYDIDRQNNISTKRISVSSRTTLLTRCLARQGRIEEAFQTIDEAAMLLKNDTSCAYIGELYLDAAYLAFDAGNYEKSIEYSNKSDSLLAKEFPVTYSTRLNNLENKITAYSSLGNYDEAVNLSKYKIQIKQEIYKENPSEYKTDIFRLANLEAFSSVNGNAGNLTPAKEHIAEYVRLESEMIKKQVIWLTSDQRMSYWEKAQQTLDNVSGFINGLKAFNEQLDIDVYNTHMLTSGLLLRTEKSMSDVISSDGTDSEKQLYSELVALRNQLAEAKRMKNVNEAANCQIRIQTIENELLKSVSQSPAFASFFDTDYTAIRSALKQGDVLIDFVGFNNRGKNEQKLFAFIIRSEWEFPQMIKICNENEVTELSESLDAKIYEGNLSKQIRALVLDSIMTYVSPNDRIYYVPTSILHGIALENLVTESGKHMYEVYDMRRLSYASALINSTHNDFRPKNAVIYGDLDYGDYKIEKSKKTAETIHDEKEYPDGETRGVGDAYEKLTYAPYEVEHINSALKKKRVKTTCHRDNGGTEESFIAMDGKSPDVIHLSTHGYYLSPERAKKVSGLSGYTDAMRLSGLVLSGGNAGWLGIPTKNGELDGLLSAEEISKLNFSQTKFVVLSACKTASGKTSPDGIYGLQRAFKKAGVGSIMMTLWEVNDRATAIFMGTFYDQLIKNGWDKHKAFNKARSITREQFQDAYYWAGFVLLD